ncbi:MULTISPECIES: HEAT repeat domain-containing protein [unclassified Microcoleus]|uniref:HEAT repeat domain-containing protein n=1 Tax=unclassified Microcoleus TaxID=2642155 RepID=UPI0025F0431E|nr:MULTISPECIES: HEAT repeat domain-containing protein [unclassified Microcoleus]
MEIIGAIVGFLAGIAVAYWLVEKRLHKQKQEHLLQTRRIAQDIELAQISRMQQTTESPHQEGEDRLRKATVEHENLLRQVTAQYENQIQQVATQYENRLQQVLAERDRLQQVGGSHEQQIRQVTQELEAAYNAKLQENIQSLQAEHERHILTLSDELHDSYQAQMDEHFQNLQKQHEIQLRQAASQYGNSEFDIQSTTGALQQQYESQLQAAQEQFQAREAQMLATIRSLQEQYESNVQQQEIPEQQFSQLNPTEFTSDLPQQEVWQEDPYNQFNQPEFNQPEFNQPEVEQELNYTGFSEPQSIDLEQLEIRQTLESPRQTPNYSSVAQLMGCVQSQDTETRKFAASALGKMGAANALRTDGQRAIETLGKLAQDFNPEVREAAVEALAMIKSEKVIPLLQRALRDTDSGVAKSASAALNKFKFYPRTPAVKPKLMDIKKPKR